MEIQEALVLAENMSVKKYLEGENLSDVEDALLTLGLAYRKLIDSAENRSILKQKKTLDERIKILETELEKVHKALAASAVQGKAVINVEDGKVKINLDDGILLVWAVEGIDIEEQKKIPTWKAAVLPKIIKFEEPIQKAIRAAFPDGEVWVTSASMHVMEPF